MPRCHRRFLRMEKLDAKGKLKQPYAIAMADDAQMVMAGLWAKWKSPANGEEVLSCTVLTCGPNKAMGELHDRMPVILAENDCLSLRQAALSAFSAVAENVLRNRKGLQVGCQLRVLGYVLQES